MLVSKNGQYTVKKVGDKELVITFDKVEGEIADDQAHSFSQFLVYGEKQAILISISRSLKNRD